MKLPIEIEIERDIEAIQERQVMQSRIIALENQLKAERDLRASIAADLRKISELFNQLIAS